MKPKSTTGPWNIEYQEPLDTYIIKNNDESVAIICGTKQDTALFAAAPEMYDVIKSLMKLLANNSHDWMNTHQSTLETAATTLKKARGEA